jgi:alkylated DNA repair dioxygenase AlkB
MAHPGDSVDDRLFDHATRRMHMHEQGTNHSDPAVFEKLEQDSAGRTPEKLVMADADVIYYRTFFTRLQSDTFYQALLDTTNWKQEKIKLYGKPMDLPRLTAWYGDEGKSYSYSGIRVDPDPWTPALLAIKQEIEAVSEVCFNSVLLNLYRGGRDSVAWHSDDEPELGTDPVIGSVSFGETRNFQLRHKQNKELRVKVDLTHGSYLLMTGPTQHHWQHQVPKAARAPGSRINLTFRIIQ